MYIFVCVFVECVELSLETTRRRRKTVTRSKLISCKDNHRQHSSFKYLHFEWQYLSTNSWAYLRDEAVIASARSRMMANEIC